MQNMISKCRDVREKTDCDITILKDRTFRSDQYNHYMLWHYEVNFVAGFLQALGEIDAFKIISQEDKLRTETGSNIVNEIDYMRCQCNLRIMSLKTERIYHCNEFYERTVTIWNEFGRSGTYRRHIEPREQEIYGLSVYKVCLWLGVMDEIREKPSQALEWYMEGIKIFSKFKN